MFLFVFNTMVLLRLSTLEELDNAPDVMCIPRTLLNVYTTMMRGQREKRILCFLITALYFVIMVIFSAMFSAIYFRYVSLSTTIITWIIIDAFLFSGLSVNFLLDACVNSLKTEDSESTSLLETCDGWCGSVKLDEKNQECCCCMFLLNVSAKACVLLISALTLFYTTIGSKHFITLATDQLKTVAKLCTKKKNHKKDDSDGDKGKRETKKDASEQKKDGSNAESDDETKIETV